MVATHETPDGRRCRILAYSLKHSASIGRTAPDSITASSQTSSLVALPGSQSRTFSIPALDVAQGAGRQEHLVGGGLGDPPDQGRVRLRPAEFQYDVGVEEIHR